MRVDLVETPLPKLVRNYRMSNAKLPKALGFTPSRTVLEIDPEHARPTAGRRTSNSRASPYYNIRWMTLLENVHVSQREFASIY